jgi:hypothetical protein
MSDAVQEFDRGDLFINNVLSAEATEGRIAVHNGARDVFTLGPGWAGFSRGPVYGEITFTRAVPRAGFDSGQDMVPVVTNTSLIKVRVLVGAYFFEVQGIAKNLERAFGEAKTAEEPITVTGRVICTPV